MFWKKGNEVLFEREIHPLFAHYSPGKQVEKFPNVFPRDKMI